MGNPDYNILQLSASVKQNQGCEPFLFLPRSQNLSQKLQPGHAHAARYCACCWLGISLRKRWHCNRRSRSSPRESHPEGIHQAKRAWEASSSSDLKRSVVGFAAMFKSRGTRRRCCRSLPYHSFRSDLCLPIRDPMCVWDVLLIHEQKLCYRKVRL